MPGFIQRHILRAVQSRGRLTVAEASDIVGPGIDPRNIRRAFKRLYCLGLVRMSVRPVITICALTGRVPSKGAVASAQKEEGHAAMRHAPSKAAINPVARPSAPARPQARVANYLSPPPPVPVSPNPPARLTAPLSPRGAAPPQAATRQASGTSPSPGSGSSPAPRPRPRSSPGKGAAVIARNRVGGDAASAAYPNPGVWANPADAYAEQIRAKVELQTRKMIGATARKTI